MEIKTKTMRIGAQDFTVKEMDVAGIRALIQVKPADVVDQLLLEDVSLTELAAMYGVEPAAFDGLTGTDLEQLRAAATEVNAHFFGLLGRVAKYLVPAR